MSNIGLFTGAIKWAVVLLLFSPRVYAQDIGAAYFALLSPQFPCESALSIFDNAPRPALAILWGTFGSDLTCLKKWDQRTAGRPRVLEVHLSNEPCRRNKRCEANDFLAALDVNSLNRALVSRDPKVIAALRERVQEIAAAVKPLAQAQTELILSTGLEDNFNSDAFRVVAETVKLDWKYKLVRNPVKAGTSTGADYIELHGDHPQFSSPQRCIANLDGQDIVFPHRRATLSNTVSWAGLTSYLQRYRDTCRVTFVWSALWQGIEHETPFVPPSKRRFVVPDDDTAALRSKIDLLNADQRHS